MPTLSRFRTLALVLLAIAAFKPAMAQVDPRLQVAGSSDLLDVYKVKSGEPELITVFDFSASMHAVYWDPRYFTKQNENTHGSNWGLTGFDAYFDYPGLVPVMDKYGYIRIYQGTGNDNDIWGTTQPSQFVSATDPTYGARLVSPDGTVVFIPDGKTTYTQASLLPYVEKASHIRVTAKDPKNGTLRTIDLPIPWAIFDRVSSSNAQGIITKVNDVTPKGVTMGVPVTPDALGVDFDGSINNSKVENILNDNGKSQFKIGRFHYNPDFLWWIFFGTDVKNATQDGSTDTGAYVIPAYSTSSSAGTTWSNGLVGMTRFQALKNAVVRSWFINQGQVWWGYRYLDSGAESKKNTVNSDNGSAATTAISRDIRLFGAQPTSSQPDSHLKAFLEASPTDGTPLTYALANTYAQLSIPGDTGDSSSALGKGTSANGIPNGQSGTEPEPIQPCRRTFVVVFTDGIATDGFRNAGDDSALGTADPYAVGTDTKGDTNVRALGTSHLSPSAAGTYGPVNSMFNTYTLAGLAAHYEWTKTGLYGGYINDALLDSSNKTPNGYIAPFPITSRGRTPDNPGRIRTMTVGLSIGGALNDPSVSGVNGKYDLFRAALYGNPKNGTWNLTDKPFDPNPANGNNDPNTNPFFFDAQDVNGLANAMTAILAEVTAGSAAIAAPASPLVGLSLGNQVYLGLFETNTTPRWKGDLLMAGLYLGSQGVTFIDKNGAIATNVTSTNAVWSAYKDIFKSEKRVWPSGVSGSRLIYTNLPGTNTLTSFDENNALITAPMVGATTIADRTSFIRFMRGATPQGETDTTNLIPRDTIMGDIVNSAPTVLEYPIAALTGSVSPLLAGHISDVPSGSIPHFRVIFAGDNQGIFHAFGELSWTTAGTITLTDALGNTTTASAQIPHGFVDELWAFIPGEFLKYIPSLRNNGTPHRYLMDGTPTVYFKDVPAAGEVRGNGLVDGSDVVRVMVGERKGGRSYYAFDFANLNNVVGNTGSIMAWSLVPDTYTATSGTANTIRHMGYSTTTPAIARVDIGSTLNQDLVFLGGGLSTAAVDANFAADSTFNDTSAKMGRSVFAFDVVTGPSKNLYTWDFTASGGFVAATFGGPMGCVPAGVVPLEFFQGSGHTQRVYFADTPTDPNSSATRGAGVWALGSNGLTSDPSGVIRADSQDISTWQGTTNKGLRHIFQTPVGWSITTSPNPFLLSGGYPVFRDVKPLTEPSVVGLAFGTGDRNDPIDSDAINPAVVTKTSTTPYNNWMNVVFDRQDSSSVAGLSKVADGTNFDLKGIQQGGTVAGDGDIADLTTVGSTLMDAATKTYSVDPSNSAFYLKQKVGYKLNLGAATPNGSGFYYPKVITNTSVLNGVLFFSDFSPSAGTQACTGTGNTFTIRVCNIISPIFNNATASLTPGTTTASSTSFNGGDPSCSGIVLTYPNLPGEITALGTSAVIQSGQGSANGQPGTISNAGASVQGSVGNTSGRGFKPRSWRIVR